MIYIHIWYKTTCLFGTSILTGVHYVDPPPIHEIYASSPAAKKNGIVPSH